MVKLYEEFSSSNLRVEPAIIDAIRFGYPTEEIRLVTKVEDPIVQFFETKGFLREIVQNAPKNSGKQTQQDLAIIKSRMETVTVDDLAFARIAEENIELLFFDFFRSKGAVVSLHEIQSVVNSLHPICYYLKNLVQRPRPSQLAWYYRSNLYQSIHTDANSAAYPSGHALSSYAISKYFGRNMPELQGELQVFAERVADSRVYTGIHYPSDSVASQKICDIIFKHDLL